MLELKLHLTKTPCVELKEKQKNMKKKKQWIKSLFESELKLKKYKKVFHLILSRIEAFHLQNGYYQSVCNLLIWTFGFDILLLLLWRGWKPPFLKVFN